MSAHTPGPWKFGNGQHSNAYRHEIEAPPTPRGRRIVVARIPTPKGASAEATANARLIAAAPDLLAQLKALVSIVEMNVAPTIFTKEARAAIAKAEGRET